MSGGWLRQQFGGKLIPQLSSLVVADMPTAHLCLPWPPPGPQLPSARIQCKFEFEIYLALVHLGVAEALLDGVHALAEQVHVELLEPVRAAKKRFF